MYINLNSESTLMFIMLFFVFILMGILPFLSRKEILFGIRIEKEMMDEQTMKGYTYKYIRRLLFLDAVLLIFLYLGSMHFPLEFVYTVVIIGMIFIQGFSYISVHLEVKRHKENFPVKAPETVVVTTDEKINGVDYPLASIFWFGIPLIINAYMYIYNALIYQEIPEQLKVAFDFNGNIMRMVAKSPAKVFMIPHISLLTLLIFVFVYYAIKMSKKQLDARKPNESKERVLRFRRIWSAWTILMATILTTMFFMLNLLVIGKMNESKTFITLIAIVPTFIIVLSLIILAVYTGQGGSRLKVRSDEDFEKANRNDDAYWKLGMFYVNKEDPSFMVEKRFGVGWTINLGNRKAVIGFVLAIVLLIAISILTSI
ncbi:MAG: DUF5808 domain-containing protein [Peptostreptococcales bacterium]